MTTYAVTGATGHLGRLVIDELLTRGVPAGDVVAVVRTPAKAADLAARGVQVREGDYDRPQTLPAALAGVQRLLLISGNEVGKRLPQHQAVIEAATAVGVQHLAYTSLLHADTTTLPIAAEHVATEQALRTTGIRTTVLRNGWYIENYTGQLEQYLATGAILGSTGGAPISAAARADYAAAAAAALTADGTDGTDGTREDATRVYELGGPALTLDELAAAITEATGSRVTHRDVSAEQHAAALQQAGLDAATAGFLTTVDAAIAHGDLHTDRDDLARLLGRPATPLTDTIRTASTARTS